MVPTPGHTPGHMSLAIISQGQHGYILGDVASSPSQMQDTLLGSLFDIDKELARRTRERVLNQLEPEGFVLLVNAEVDTLTREYREQIDVMDTELDDLHPCIQYLVYSTSVIAKTSSATRRLMPKWTSSKEMSNCWIRRWLRNMSPISASSWRIARWPNGELLSSRFA